MKTKHEVSFNLQMTRLGFLQAALKLTWASIRGRKAVWICDIGCDGITIDGQEL